MYPICSRVFAWMGCTPSVPEPPEYANQAQFGPPPPIPVDIGSSVKANLKHDVVIIFIFGGPASQKGMIIQELSTAFNFVSISVEDVVFHYLPGRVANTGDSVKDIQDTLKRDPGLITVDWVLSMISAKISTSMHQRYVIDIVPTLTSIIKSDSYRNKAQDRSLDAFERKHPISFALEIGVQDEMSLTDSKLNLKDKDENGPPEVNKFAKGVDENEKGNLLKRIDEYHQCANPFVKYFKSSRRVVNLSVNSNSFSNLVPKTREVLVDLGFTLTRRDEHVIVFSTESNHDGIDLNYYKLKEVNAQDLCKPNDSLVKQVGEIYKYITNNSRPDDNFLVVVSNFKSQDAKQKRRINFTERKKEVYLDEFIRNKRHDKQPLKRKQISVNCISSSRQVLLFFEPFPHNLAESISQIYMGQRDLKAGDS